jgi:hypothetical protein
MAKWRRHQRRGNRQWQSGVKAGEEYRNENLKMSANRRNRRKWLQIASLHHESKLSIWKICAP